MWKRVMVAASALLLAVSARSSGAESHTGEPSGGGSVPSSMTKFYGGSLVRVGEFPGKLVCLRCDLKGGPEAMAQCQKEGHRHALSMDSDGMIHPLLPATEVILEQINSGALHGKTVTVHGKYYVATGAILVDQITENP